MTADVAADPVEAERLRVLRAGQRLIGQDASRRTTIEDVLREAGVNRRIFYRHFRSKDELVLAMVDEAGATVQAALDEQVGRAPDAARALATYVSTLLAIGWDERQSREGAAFLSYEVTQTPGVPAALEDVYAQHRHLLEDVLARGLVDGTLPAAVPARDAFAIHAVVVRYLDIRVRGRLDLSLDDVRDNVLGLFGPALGAS
ncbi:MAG: putative tetR family transcriptional regulatory protein [Aeromicrobium sp.]|nr:putative tetR family transcriptional regulatory protein [Aeromicrobium sp.]